VKGGAVKSKGLPLLPVHPEKKAERLDHVRPCGRLLRPEAEAADASS
jgi:hypothetical protein